MTNKAKPIFNLKKSNITLMKPKPRTPCIELFGSKIEVQVDEAEQEEALQVRAVLVESDADDEDVKLTDKLHHNEFLLNRFNRKIENESDVGQTKTKDLLTLE